MEEPNSPDSTVDDLDILHQSLKGQHSEDFLYTSGEEKDTEEITQFHRTVQTLFEEEENLLNLHMSVIQVRPTQHRQVYRSPFYNLQINLIPPTSFQHITGKR
jgi:hypothetical protein